jgi:hypothetical protein
MLPGPWSKPGQNENRDVETYGSEADAKEFATQTGEKHLIGKGGQPGFGIEASFRKRAEAQLDRETGRWTVTGIWDSRFGRGSFKMWKVIAKYSPSERSWRSISVE